MFGLKRKKDFEDRNESYEPEQAQAEADKLVRQTLSELNRGLVVKREVRERTARLVVGALRPVAKAR